MVPIKGSKFILRPWRLTDAASLQRHANNINVARFLFDRFPHPYTKADAERWVLAHQSKAVVTNLAIVIDDNAVGAIDFKQGDDIYRKSASIGYWLGEQYWGRGIATEAIRLIIPYAFYNFDIIRIQATVNGNNLASMRVLEKAGFTKEGIMKDAIIKGGEIMDEHLYAILKDA
ncbi:GNAT family N-acetyltransferase [Mucilaginibacter rubeus]|uniref:GNAT family N-acetyltransferase n=1 Tax=Mucilaginibacter rubeus TaxID=2027860 RepID=A0A5C1HXB2_9SPHI|nr:GNAT family protein [Mucilaginibacter rubeus]QEM10069.1 GNAT family N-acetyltransferase [Mucilaginibacter rubeus]